MLILFLFVLGICIGSFLNVLIDRLPRNESIFGRSHCESCKTVLKWKDLFPIISFMFLKGKCRYCSTPLSYQYPVLEILTGLMFVFVFVYISMNTIFNYQFSIINDLLVLSPAFVIQLFFFLFIVSSFIVIFFADLKYGIIPDKIILPSILVSLIWLVTLNQEIFISHLISSFGAFGFFLTIFLITKGKGMGFGDVKLALLMGLILGISGTILALYVAFLTGGIIGIILILWKKKTLKNAVPFGPFLVVGFLISLFFSEQITQYFLAIILK